MSDIFKKYMNKVEEIYSEEETLIDSEANDNESDNESDKGDETGETDETDETDTEAVKPAISSAQGAIK